MNSLEAFDIGFEFINDADFERYQDFMKQFRKMKRDLKHWFLITSLSIPKLTRWRFKRVLASYKK